MTLRSLAIVVLSIASLGLAAAVAAAEPSASDSLPASIKSLPAAADSVDPRLLDLMTKINIRDIAGAHAMKGTFDHERLLPTGRIVMANPKYAKYRPSAAMMVGILGDSTDFPQLASMLRNPFREDSELDTALVMFTMSGIGMLSSKADNALRFLMQAATDPSFFRGSQFGPAIRESPSAQQLLAGCSLVGFTFSVRPEVDSFLLDLRQRVQGLPTAPMMDRILKTHDEMKPRVSAVLEALERARAK